MKTLELQISLPLNLEKYQIGQYWTFLEQSKIETSKNGAQIQVLKDLFEEKFRHTHKIYKVQHRIPLFIR